MENRMQIEALKAAGLSEKQIELAIKFANGNGKTGKQPKPCKCGCGEMTKGGTYKPGHDAKHLSAVLRGVEIKPEAPKPVKVKGARKPKPTVVVMPEVTPEEKVKDQNEATANVA